MVPASVTILLADDEPDLLESLRLAFRIEGYAVQTFSNGQAVLDFLEDSPPPTPFALVSDILMPGLGGLDLIREFKHRYPAQAAIAITGHGDKPMVMELLRSGCDDFLDKPFEPSEVLASMHRALALCQDREHAIRMRLQPNTPSSPSLRAVETALHSFDKNSNADEPTPPAPKLRLRAIEALEKEIQHSLPASKHPIEEGLPTGSFTVAVEKDKARLALTTDCLGPRSAELRTLCEDLVTRGIREIDLDFTGVEDMDALSLSVLCSLSEELRSSGGGLRLHQANSAVQMLCQHLGLTCEPAAQAA